MKTGQTTSQSELAQKGFKWVDMYGDCEIWSNNQERVLFNPSTKKIVIVYSETTGDSI